MSAGTSIKGPITQAKATPDFIPKTAIATAIANSKLLPGFAVTSDFDDEQVQSWLESMRILE